MLSYAMIKDERFHPQVFQEHKKESSLESGQQPCVAEYVKILLLSFQHSQGNNFLQKRFFEYIHLCHPEWKVDDFLRQQLLINSQEPLLDYLMTEGESDPFSPTSEVSDKSKEFAHGKLNSSLDNMQRYLNGTELREKTDLLEHTAVLMLLQDWSFLRKGKPGSFIKSTEVLLNANIETDPWFSHFIYYGLLDHTTGLTDFDQMYREAAAVVVNSLEVKKYLDPEHIDPRDFLLGMYRDLHHVIKVFYQKHPDQPMPDAIQGLQEELSVAIQEMIDAITKKFSQI